MGSINKLLSSRSRHLVNVKDNHDTLIKIVRQNSRKQCDTISRAKIIAYTQSSNSKRARNFLVTSLQNSRFRRSLILEATA